MAGLIPFNRRNSLQRAGAGFENFYNMMDDFFGDGAFPGRSPLKDTFRIDIAENENAYLIEAELPGVQKENIELNIDDENLMISVTRSEEINKDEKNYIHRERRSSSMSRRIRLANVKYDKITAKLEEGVLRIDIPKDSESPVPRKIEIN